MDESDHLTLVNAGDEEVVSQEEGGREGSAAAAGGELRRRVLLRERYRYRRKARPGPGLLSSWPGLGMRPINKPKRYGAHSTG